jgi:hypothetical protein
MENKMARLVLSTTPGKTVKPENRAEFDREGTVKYFLSHKIQPICLEREDRRMIFVFDREEIRFLQDAMLSNMELPTDYRDVLLADEIWENGLALLRDSLRN